MRLIAVVLLNELGTVANDAELFVHEAPPRMN